MQGEDTHAVFKQSTFPKKQSKLAYHLVVAITSRLFLVPKLAWVSTL